MRFLFVCVLFCLCSSAVLGQADPQPADTVIQSRQTDLFNARAIKDTAATGSDSTNATVNRADSIATDTVRQPRRAPYIHQFRIGVDISRIAFNVMFPSRLSYEFQADYAWRDNVYLVAETGLGSGKVAYEHLKYQTNGFFVRVGVSKSFLDRLGPGDFDIGFLGARYGIGMGTRGEAEFFVPSPFGGGTSGTAPAQHFVVHWGELTGGVKVEVWRGIFLGWTIRGKFLFNANVFETLSPNFIPGYGKGDKKTAFDFNFYLSYAFRWGKNAE